jgi:hypothetical protein
MVALGVSTLGDWAADQRAATSARAVADAFALARAEAIRTGSNHIVAFDVESGLSGITSDVVITNDGPTGNTPGVSSNCKIEAGEVVETISLEQGVRFGSDPSLANGAPAPNDSGGSGHQLAGSSFNNATTGDASWVIFGSDGLPRRFTENGSTTPPCTALGSVGQAGGAIYLTNGHRDYAIVMSPLGTIRLHRWAGTGWTQ